MRGCRLSRWAVRLSVLAPAFGLAPHDVPILRHPAHGAYRRARHLVAQERPGPPTGRWRVRFEHQLQRYQAALEVAPMRTQMATAAVLAGVGDAIAQRIEARGAFAWRRFAALVVVNVVYIVPLLSALYAANDRLVGMRTCIVHRTVGYIPTHLPIHLHHSYPRCLHRFRQFVPHRRRACQALVAQRRV